MRKCMMLTQKQIVYLVILASSVEGIIQVRRGVHREARLHNGKQELQMSVGSFGNAQATAASAKTVAFEISSRGHLSREKEISEKENRTQKALRNSSNKYQKFWRPPSYGAGFEQFVRWRRRNLKFIRPERLVTMSPTSFLNLLRREHRAADYFGNSDGCISKDEHPDFHSLVADLSPSTRRICAYHVIKYARSSAFKRDITKVRSNHRALLKILENAQQQEIEAIEDELANLSNVTIPVDNDTHAENETSRAQLADLNAELRAEKETLESENSTEFAISEGLQPFPVDDKDEDLDLDAVDNMSLPAADNESLGDDEALGGVSDQKNVKKKGDAMDVETLLSWLKREDPQAEEHARAAMEKKVVRSERKSMVRTAERKQQSTESGVTWYIWRGGPCGLSDGGRCITSPNYPHKYSNRQTCYFMPSANTKISVEAWNTESYWDWAWIAGANTYFSGSYGPSGKQAAGGMWSVWSSDRSVKRSGWKLCAATHSETCMYNRQDVCALKFNQVPLLGTHNSGAHPTLYLECYKKKQTCVSWATEARQSCDGYYYGCKETATRWVSRCTGWANECTSWSNNYCGWFSWICGTFCSATQLVCSATEWFVESYCEVSGWICRGFTYFVEYVGCKVYEWACEAASSISFISCLWENQNYAPLQQLDYGVRYFDFDSCVVHHQLRHCHGTDYEKRAIGSLIDTDVLRFRDWLRANPNEILVIGWSNMEHGKQNVDYPSNQDGSTFHWKLRTDVIDKYFTKASSSYTCSGGASGVCYTDNKFDLKVADMVTENVRLVVHRKEEFVLDSWTDASSGGGEQELMDHLGDYCDGKVTGQEGELPQNSNSGAKLSGFVSLKSTAAYSESGEYILDCPNHCSHPSGNAAQCECSNNIKGSVLTLTLLGTLIEGNGTDNKSEVACNNWNAGVVNDALAGGMQGIANKCLNRNVPVSVVMVDYISKSGNRLQTAHQNVVDASVAKWR